MPETVATNTVQSLETATFNGCREQGRLTAKFLYKPTSASKLAGWRWLNMAKMLE
jgi:hypothetical protein